MDLNPCAVCGGPIPYRRHDGLRRYATVTMCSSHCRGEAASRKEAARFWDKVKKTPTCWLWMGNRSAMGYGRVTYLRRRTSAHRMALELATGQQPPPGSHVMHICDNPPCVNPGHLLIGDARLNAQDMVMKGRGVPGKLKGSEVATAKLDEQAVTSIKAGLARGQSQRSLAREHQISRRTIYNIQYGLGWKHVA